MHTYTHIISCENFLRVINKAPVIWGYQFLLIMVGILQSHLSKCKRSSSSKNHWNENICEFILFGWMVCGAFFQHILGRGEGVTSGYCVRELNIDLKICVDSRSLHAYMRKAYSFLFRIPENFANCFFFRVWEGWKSMEGVCN